eukprot:g25686.t1
MSAKWGVASSKEQCLHAWTVNSSPAGRRDVCPMSASVDFATWKECRQSLAGVHARSVFLISSTIHPYPVLRSHWTPR